MSKTGKTAAVLGALLAAGTGIGIVIWLSGSGGKPPAFDRRFPQEADGLRGELKASRVRFKASESTDLTVVLTNTGSDRLVILPYFSLLEFRGKGAFHRGVVDRFPPGVMAKSLGPGEKTVIEFRGLGTWTGFWQLKPGAYTVSAVYFPTQDHLDTWQIGGAERSRPTLPAGRIWTGKIETNAITLRVQPD